MTEWAYSHRHFGVVTWSLMKKMVVLFAQLELLCCPDSAIPMTSPTLEKTTWVSFSITSFMIIYHSWRREEGDRNLRSELGYRYLSFIVCLHRALISDLNIYSRSFKGSIDEKLKKGMKKKKKSNRRRRKNKMRMKSKR